MAIFLLSYFDHRGLPNRMYYVPTGKTGTVADTPRIDWVRMTTGRARRLRRIDRRRPAFTHEPEWERMLARAAISGIPVYYTKQLREALTGRIQIASVR